MVTENYRKLYVLKYIAKFKFLNILFLQYSITKLSGAPILFIFAS